jgi:hypothetical protein
LPGRPRAPAAGLAGFQPLPLSESVRLFADLMAVPLLEDSYPCLSMTAQQRDATLDAILAWLIEVAESAPVLMARGEDLHWADPTTLEMSGI